MRQQTRMGLDDVAVTAPEAAQPVVAAAHEPELPHLHAGHGHHHPPPAREDAVQAEVNIRSLAVWIRLFGLVRPVKWQFLGTLALGLFHHGSVIVLGALSALLVGAVFRDEPLTTLLILVLVFAPLSSFLFYLENWQAHDMAFRLLARMRIDLFEKLEPLAPAYMVRRRSGRLRQRGRWRRRNGRVLFCPRHFADDRGVSHTCWPAYRGSLSSRGQSQRRWRLS